MKDARVVVRMWSPYGKTNGYYTSEFGGGYTNTVAIARVFTLDEALAHFKKCEKHKPENIRSPIATILVPRSDARDLSPEEMFAKPFGHSIWPERDF